GYLMERGLGVEPNEEKAVQLYQESQSRFGNVLLGLRCLKQLPPDTQAAEQYFQLSLSLDSQQWTYGADVLENLPHSKDKYLLLSVAYEKGLLDVAKDVQNAKHYAELYALNTWTEDMSCS